MSETYVISDIHFNHKNVIEFAKRPFSDINHMRESIIELWNYTVSKRDTVICLGDWGFGANTYQIAERLNGMIRLVMGNHDKGNPRDLAKYFHSVHGSLKKGDILFTHIPIILDKYHNWEYIVHGHYHNKLENIQDYRYYNINMDAIGYYGPISLDEIRHTLIQRKIDYLTGTGYLGM